MHQVAEKSRVRRHRDLVLSSQDTTDSDHNWLITLSDVMSLLLIFFIIFFAMSRVPQTNQAKVKEKITFPVSTISQPLPKTTRESELEKIQKDMQSAIAALNLDDEVNVEAKDREILITLKEKITFEMGEAEVLKGSQPVLDTIARTIKKYPSFTVDIDGHTDDLPIKTRRFPSNWELSVARATSVLKYLIGSYDLNPARFTIKGNAEQRPLTLNLTAEERAQNRRVEIRLKESPQSGV